MNRLTARILTVVLATASAGAAYADIASTDYVDKQKTAVEGTLTTGLATKADKATTLAGYGIADAMTSAAINTALGDKANTADLGSLAGKDAVGTTDITDASVTKAKLATDVQASLGKADSALQEAALATYAKTADVNAGLDLKADKTAIADMETKTNAAATYAVKSTETVASGAAAAAAAAQGDVDALEGVVSNTTTGLAATKTIADNAAAAAAAAGTAAAAAQTDVDTLEGVVANTTTGLAATKTIADNAATAAAANATAIATKADKATTLAGYGITDAMTSAAINSALDTKASATELTTGLSAKADKATTLAGYGIADAMTANAINTALGTKANLADLGTLATAAPGACSDATNQCVLTFNGTAYSWEVIKR